MKTNRIIRYPSLSVQMTLKQPAKGSKGGRTKKFESNINKVEIDESFSPEWEIQAHNKLFTVVALINNQRGKPIR